jgi:Family of unknown function (DUF6941)
MQVTLALLADYANITGDGKLNILGIFDRIRVSALPAVHPLMQFILRLEAHGTEWGRRHTVRIRLRNPDGHVAFELGGEVFPQGADARGSAASNQIIGINNLPLAHAGEYTFVVLVDDEVRAEVPLIVEQVAGSGAPGGAVGQLPGLGGGGPLHGPLA